MVDSDNMPKGSNKPGGVKEVAIDVSQLVEINSNQGLVRYLIDIKNRKDFILADARAKAFRTARDYRWWRFWLVGSPLLEALLYGAMFSLLLKTSRGVENFAGFVILGMTLFNVFNRLLMAGVGLIESNKGIIRAFSFPTATVLLSTILRFFYDLAPSILVSSLAAVAFQMVYSPPGVSVLFSVFVLIFALLFGAGLTFITARLTAFLPDFRALLELFSRGWMFASGIFYSVERYASSPFIYQIFTANPAYKFITAFRDTLLYNTIPTVDAWVAMALWGIGTFIFGFLFFWKADKKYAKEF